MTDKYDAIIIGAGNSGLTSGLAMAQAGLNVLMLDKQRKPGGYATTFKRGNYVFEGSLHQMSGVGDEQNPGPILPYLKEMGIYDKVHYIHIHSQRIISGPYDMVLHTGRENFKQDLIKYFPEEKEGIEKFFDLAWKTWDEFQHIFHYNFDLIDPYEKLDLKANKEKYPLFFKYAYQNGWQVMDKYLKSPYLKYAFCATSMYSGPIDKISFLDLLVSPINLFSYPQAHVLGGTGVESNVLAEEFQKHNGHLKLNTEVKKILVKNNHVQGVETVDGHKYYSDCVVANASPVIVYGELMDQNEVTKKALAKYRGLTPGASFIVVYLGLDCPAMDLGMNDALTWICDITKPEQMPVFLASRDPVQPKNANQIIDAQTSASQHVNVGDGKHYGKLDIATVADTQKWLDTPPTEYYKQKYEIGRTMLNITEKYFPKLADHIVELNIASPITSARFSGAPGGATGIGGTSENHLLYPQNYDNVVKGLYMENRGAGTASGFHATLTRGFVLGKHLAKEIKETK